MRVSKFIKKYLKQSALICLLDINSHEILYDGKVQDMPYSMLNEFELNNLSGPSSDDKIIIYCVNFKPSRRDTI